MRNLGAVWGLAALLLWGACGSDGDTSTPVTRTTISVDADSGLKRAATKLHVHIDRDGDARLDKEYTKNIWPQRFNMEPRDGDASRSFELLAEAFDADGERLASQRLKTGFVAKETRYARIVLSKCNQPHMDELAPTVLVKNDTLMSSVASDCQESPPEAGSGGSGGAGGTGGAGGAGGAAQMDGGSGGQSGGGAGGTGGGGAEDVCGDGHLNANEFCDTAIMPGKQGACPSKCDSQDRCMPGTLKGSDCQAHCEYNRITEAKNGDKCCPAGASPSMDNDCKAECGNSVIEAGETCDPPTSCTTEHLCGMAPACTMAVLKGEPQTCSVTCNFQPIQTCMPGDGCCPSGCTHATDSDCPAACGDGNLDSNETCEPNSTAHPCPATCKDSDACTMDFSTGSASTCNLKCWNTPIQTAADNDGCCPASANANNDNDCKPKCNNGVREAGELCDGNCPADASACNDNDPCTKDSLAGSDCQRHCVNTKLTASTTPDGCCPAGASSTDDADCGSSTNTNLLAGKVFTTDVPESTIEPGHPKKYMTDNDDATRFISMPVSPITLTVDLGASYTLSRIDIIWAGDTIQNFSLAMSPNGTKWTTIFTGMTKNQMIDPETYTAFSATPTGQYLQIIGMDRRDSSFGNSIYEVRAYGK